MVSVVRTKNKKERLAHRMEAFVLWLIRWLYRKIKKHEPPYYYNQSIFSVIMKPIRKWITNALVPHCPFNRLRILLYRMCGFKIGKRCFIGMRCYFDDLCRKLLIIGDHVTVSYGVFFACHGAKQERTKIVVEEYAYIGMRASVISKNSENPGEGVTIGAYSVVGACTLVNKNVPPHATAVGVPCRIIMPKTEAETTEAPRTEQVAT